jgi:inosose dehydratase
MTAGPSPSLSRSQTWRLGHTGITWPFTPEGAAQAMSDVAATGYQAVELFGFVLDAYPGGIEAVKAALVDAGLDYAASYCSLSLVDPNLHQSDLDSMQRWARQIRELGGTVAVVGPDQKKRSEYGSADYQTIAGTLAEVGRLCADVGVTACFHPHTGTPVETRDEIAQVMDRIDPSVVFMAPDTGQIAKGSADPVEVVRTYKDLVKHIHLKDYVGGTSTVDWEGHGADRTGYLDYVPLGEGVVDVREIVSVLGPDYRGWLMVELDGTDQAPRPPRDAAAISKRYMDGLLDSLQSLPAGGRG